MIRDYAATRADELSITEGEFLRLKTKPKRGHMERDNCFEVEKETIEEGKLRRKKDGQTDKKRQKKIVRQRERKKKERQNLSRSMSLLCFRGIGNLKIEDLNFFS